MSRSIKGVTLGGTGRSTASGIQPFSTMSWSGEARDSWQHHGGTHSDWRRIGRAAQRADDSTVVGVPGHIILREGKRVVITDPSRINDPLSELGRGLPLS